MAAVVQEITAVIGAQQERSRLRRHQEASVSSGAETRGEGVLFRVLLLYGTSNLCHNLAFLLGYHMLPQGAMKGTHPAYTIASRVAASSGFWSEFGGTLLVNLVVMGAICTLLNLQRVGTTPLGHLVTAVVLLLFAGAGSLGPRVARTLVGASALALVSFDLYQLWSGLTALIHRAQ